jgi:hypothetical protein
MKNKIFWSIFAVFLSIGLFAGILLINLGVIGKASSTTPLTNSEWISTSVSSSLLLQDSFFKKANFNDWALTLSAYEIFQLNDLQNYAKDNYGSIQAMILYYGGNSTLVFADGQIRNYSVSNFSQLIDVLDANEQTGVIQGGAIVMYYMSTKKYSVLQYIGRLYEPLSYERLTKDEMTRLETLRSYENGVYGGIGLFGNMSNNTAIKISRHGEIKEIPYSGVDGMMSPSDEIHVIKCLVLHCIWVPNDNVQPNPSPEWVTVAMSSNMLYDPFFGRPESNGWMTTLSAYEIFQLNELQNYADSNYGSIDNMIENYSENSTLVFANGMVKSYQINAIDELMTKIDLNSIPGAIILYKNPEKNGFDMLHYVGRMFNPPIVEHLTNDLTFRITSLRNFEEKAYGGIDQVPENTSTVITRYGSVIETPTGEIDTMVIPSDILHIKCYLFHYLRLELPDN